MDLEEHINLIRSANASYRLGEPVMSDAEYDKLIDELRAVVTPEKFSEIVSTLNEGAVEGDDRKKVRHPFIMGSLEKLKYEEPKVVRKFIDKRVNGRMSVSAKVDGISCRLHYENGILTAASTRGDGFLGVDCTDKISYVKFIPKTFGTETMDIRGELVILKDDFATMEGYANPRNACAGIFNRKDPTIDELAKVSFVAYTILGDKYTKAEQFSILEQTFKVAWHTEIDLDMLDSEDDDVVEVLFEMANQDFDYETDGLVICDVEYRNEAKYTPDACMAFKLNLLAAQTRLIDVIWQGPQKNGRFNPVAVLEPIKLAGSMISRATIHNNDFIRKMNLRYGSIVQVVKGGDVIPHLVKVVSNGENTKEIEFPTVCPCCGTKLVETNLYMVCPNANCSDQLTLKTQHFLEKLDIDNISFKRLKQFNLNTIEDLIRFRPNEKYKLEKKLYQDLNTKLFNKSKRDIFAATDFEGISKKTLKKIFDFYGFETAVKHENLVGLPVGVGDKTMAKFLAYVDGNAKIVDEIVSDGRYSYVEQAEPDARPSVATIIGSICFTGSLKTMGRKEASNLAERNGFEVKNSVTKGLTYLVTNDPNSGSTKNEKAKKLGTIVIGEDEFLKLMNSNGMNVDDL